MSVEYILAERTARRDRGSRASIMMRIAWLSALVGVAIMVVALAVVGGFRREMNSIVGGLGGEILVSDYSSLMGSAGGELTLSEEVVEQLLAIEGVERVAPFVLASGMARNAESVVGLQIKGVDPSFDSRWWREHIVEGELPDVQSEVRHKSLLLSRTTARQLELGVGDSFEMLSPALDGRPRRDKFRVVGIYHTGLEEMDSALALGDIRDARSTIRVGRDKITGYEIECAEGVEPRQVVARVSDYLAQSEQESLQGAIATSLEERYAVLFDWLKTHKVNARVVIAIVMVVLLFNLASAILVMVLERRAMIGVLKSMGMRNGSIRRLFLMRAAMLLAKGAVWGNLIGLVLVAVQALWRPIKLDAEGYLLSYLPVSVEWGWWLLLNVGVAVVAIVVMLLPTALVTRITPAESLRYRL